QGRKTDRPSRFRERLEFLQCCPDPGNGPCLSGHWRPLLHSPHVVIFDNTCQESSPTFSRGTQKRAEPLPRATPVLLGEQPRRSRYEGLCPIGAGLGQGLQVAQSQVK